MMATANLTSSAGTGRNIALMLARSHLHSTSQYATTPQQTQNDKTLAVKHWVHDKHAAADEDLDRLAGKDRRSQYQHVQLQATRPSPR
jgi:hypothetical protein